MRKISLILITILISSILIDAGTVISPEETFGFRMGTDKKLIDWEQITNYFRALEKNSKKIIVKQPGKTTMGKPFIYAIISSEENIKKLDRYREIQKQIANPYNLTPENAKNLFEKAKAVVLISLNIHSTEIASSQESVELAYELVTRNDEKTLSILDDVIIIMIPSLNPDGQQIVTDWYRKTVNTPSEGSYPPELYHYYAGHDNNRDWFMFNLAESKLTAKLLYHEWFPQIVYDQHQMGGTGPRLFIPPYSDPINPNVNSLLIAEVNMLGRHVVTDLTEQGFTGIVNRMRFNSYFQGTMSKTPLWHNMIGILSEMASANLASPVFIPSDSLGKYDPSISRYSRRNDFLNPWKGDWWRLRDIIEYEKAVTYSILDLASKYREKFIRNFYYLNKKSIEKGKNEKPHGVLIPLSQHDPGSARIMLERIRLNGAKIYRITKNAEARGKKISAGTYFIPFSQPCRPFLKDIFEIQKYPNLQEYPGGPPLSPYDVTGWTIQLQMGVKINFMKNPADFEIEPAEKFIFGQTGIIGEGKDYLVFERRYNCSFNLLNILLKKNVPVSILKNSVRSGTNTFSTGDFIVAKNSRTEKLLKDLAEKHSIPVYSLDASFLNPVSQQRVNKKKIGIFHSWTLSMDEGWTRLVLDNHGFSYKKVYKDDIIKGSLKKYFDVIIIPDLSSNAIVEGTTRWDKYRTAGSPVRPEKYRGGIGEKGITELSKFIKSGGTLITLGRSSDFAIKKLRVPAYNILDNVSRKEYYSPGSLLKINLNKKHPIAYGMREYAIVRSTNSPAFKLLRHNRENLKVGYFAEDNPLRSGWLIGWEKLSGKTALADIHIGQGRAVLFGFRTQSRGQTFGSFKLLFNSIYLD